MTGEIIITKEVIDIVKSIYKVEDNCKDSITYIPNYGTCKTVLTVGKPYEFTVEFETQTDYNYMITYKDFNQMTLFTNFLEGVFATLEVLSKDKEISNEL